jgi:hypothetical protein
MYRCRWIIRRPAAFLQRSPKKCGELRLAIERLGGSGLPSLRSSAKWNGRPAKLAFV